MKKYILNLIPFIIGTGCFVAFSIIGSEVAPDGTLVEPFFLIPLGFIFFFVGIIELLVSAVLYYLDTKKSSK